MLKRNWQKTKNILVILKGKQQTMICDLYINSTEKIVYSIEFYLHLLTQFIDAKIPLMT